MLLPSFKELLLSAGKRPTSLTLCAAFYARYSSDNQDASSIDQQLLKCRERADREGLKYPPELFFKDEAISGARLDREGFALMVQAARAGLFSTLIIEHSSRLCRELALLKTYRHVNLRYSLNA